MKMILSDKKFTAFFWAQFFGAFNDNFLKNALVLLITFKGIKVGQMQSHTLVALSGGIFIFPFFLFSTHAGQLADKIEKTLIIKITKIWELIMMLIAGFGFYFECYELLLVLLFLMGTHSTFFGPVKYSIISHLVPTDQLLKGNAYVESGTFIAVLLGTLMGGWSVSQGHSLLIITGGLVSVALLGVWTSWKIPHIGNEDSSIKVTWNPFPAMKEITQMTRRKSSVFHSIMGISWFWFFGAGILSVLPSFCKDTLGAQADLVTFFLALFTVGVGTGSLSCERLSRKRWELKLIPIGSLGMTLFMFDLYVTVQSHFSLPSPALLSLSTFWSHEGSKRIAFDFFIMSFSGGIFTVPLYTLIQSQTEKAYRSRVIAANNIYNAVFMVLASLMIMGLFSYFSLAPHQILLILGIINLFFGICLCAMVPECLFSMYFFLTRKMK